MALWSWLGLRKGVITTHYPEVTDLWAGALPTPPLFDPWRLTTKIADQLVEVCPSRALAREGAFLVLDLGACTSCGVCLRLAGAAARPSGVFELAATSRAHLVKYIPVEGGSQ